MTTTQEHIKAARGLIRGFQGLEAAAEALEAVGTAEERLYSLNQETAKAVEARHAAETSAKVAQDNLAFVTTQVKAARADLAQVRGQMLEAAKGEASAVVDAARAEADLIVAAAKDKAVAQNVKAKALADKADDLAASVAAKQAELTELQGAIDGIRSKLLG